MKGVSINAKRKSTSANYARFLKLEETQDCDLNSTIQLLKLKNRWYSFRIVRFSDISAGAVSPLERTRIGLENRTMEAKQY